jgi:hypothetical protein
MPSAGFEPVISAIKRLQAHALDQTTTGIGEISHYTLLTLSKVAVPVAARSKA